MGDEDGGTGRIFVSYAGVDRTWAEWAAWQLEDADYDVELDCWDWRVGDNSVARINAALKRDGVRVLALFSAGYFDPAHFMIDQWSPVLAAGDRLIPVRLDDAEPPPSLRPLVASSLVGLNEEEARQALYDAVTGPRRPHTEPPFPRAGAGSGRRLPGSLPRVWNLPGRNAGFTGRDKLLEHLRQALTTRSPVAVRALRGRGGVGKTQLAIEYAYRYAADYELAWWISSEEVALIPDQLAALAVKTGVALADMPVGEACEALAAELRSGGGWLLVFDNAEDPAALARYLPSGGGHVLITSRNPNWYARAVPIDVDAFSRAESTALLCNRVRGLPEADAAALAKGLEDLPLALEQAAALLAAGMTVETYQRLLGERISEVLDEGCPDGYPVSLAAQIRLSSERLAGTSPAALTLLRACALLAPEPFPLHACVHPVPDLPPALAGLLADPLAAGRASSALARQGLARTQDGMVQLHRLTQAVVRGQLTAAERAEGTRAAEALLTAAVPDGTGGPATWAAWSDLIPHMLAFEPAELATARGRFAVLDACWYLMDGGHAATALPHLRRLQHTWTEQFGPDHPHTLRAAQFLVRAHADTGGHALARELNEDTLARMRRVWGEDDPNTLAGAAYLATLLARAGETQEARKLEEDTLARMRRVLGEDDPHTLGVFANLANRLEALGDHQAARALGEDIVARMRRVLGEDHPATLAGAANLANRLAQLDDLDAARTLAEDTLARQRRTAGEDDRHTLITAFNLVTVLLALEETEAARKLAEDTLTRQRRTLGWDHLDTLGTAHNLAVCLSALGEVQAARELDGDTVRWRTRVLGADHPDTLRTAANLAVRLGRLEETEAARHLVADTLSRMRRVLGDCHPDVLNTADLLAEWDERED
ncbi:FxSxx-COOH system tetratricopeptide repeat protein [Streptomyces sp. NPDC002763]|uniref:FxSxx-COOH system tetratricopeptide repeat protein n=1 Tax=Streptomyces sp. NPDC002763 TaxID=3154427 RepID=UPI00332CEBF2